MYCPSAAARSCRRGPITITVIITITIIITMATIITTIITMFNYY